MYMLQRARARTLSVYTSYVHNFAHMCATAGVDDSQRERERKREGEKERQRERARENAFDHRR